MNDMIFYLIGFFIIVYIARMIGEKAIKHLNTEQKAGLIDLFATERKYGSLIVLSLVIGFLIVLQFKLVATHWAFMAYFTAMLIYMAVKNFRTYSKLTAHKYPYEYITKVLWASVLATLGIIIFFSLIFLRFLV